MTIKPKKLSSYGQAFQDARNKKQRFFEWNGQTHPTRLADETEEEWLNYLRKTEADYPEIAYYQQMRTRDALTNPLTQQIYDYLETGVHSDQLNSRYAAFDPINFPRIKAAYDAWNKALSSLEWGNESIDMSLDLREKLVPTSAKWQFLDHLNREWPENLAITQRELDLWDTSGERMRAIMNGQSVDINSLLGPDRARYALLNKLNAGFKRENPSSNLEIWEDRDKEDAKYRFSIDDIIEWDPSGEKTYAMLNGDMSDMYNLYGTNRLYPIVSNWFQKTLQKTNPDLAKILSYSDNNYRIMRDWDPSGQLSMRALTQGLNDADDAALSAAVDKEFARWQNAHTHAYNNYASYMPPSKPLTSEEIWDNDDSPSRSIDILSNSASRVGEARRAAIAANPDAQKWEILNHHPNSHENTMARFNDELNFAYQIPLSILGMIYAPGANRWLSGWASKAFSKMGSVGKGLNWGMNKLGGAVYGGIDLYGAKYVYDEYKGLNQAKNEYKELTGQDLDIPWYYYAIPAATMLPFTTPGQKLMGKGWKGLKWLGNKTGNFLDTPAGKKLLMTGLGTTGLMYGSKHTPTLNSYNSNSENLEYNPNIGLQYNLGYKPNIGLQYNSNSIGNSNYQLPHLNNKKIPPNI